MPIYVLDDIFSGLDSKSIRHICSSLFSEEGYFRQTGRIVILATHTREYFRAPNEGIGS